MKVENKYHIEIKISAFSFQVLDKSGRMASVSPPVSPSPGSSTSSVVEEEETEEIEIECPSTEETNGPIQKEQQLEHLCHLCSEKFDKPRVLSCLHVFCSACLEKQLESDNNEEEKDDISGTIICSLCKQATHVGTKGVGELAQDYVMMNMLDMSAIEDMQIVCTSCKAREKAVARCSDCANFLCPNCVTAHQYMRCFENHKVSSLL